MGRRTSTSSTSSTETNQSDEQTNKDSSQTKLDELASLGGGAAAGTGVAGAAAGAGTAGAGTTVVVDPVLREILPDSILDAPDQATPEQDAPNQEPPSEIPDQPSSSGESWQPVEQADSERPDQVESDEESSDEAESADRTGKMVIHTDPWSALTWCLDPLFKRIQVLFGGSVDLHFAPAPPRTFAAPSAMQDRWKAISKGRSMPVNLAVWDSEPPQSTELSTRAFCAAFAQGQSLATDYLRRLQIASLVEGRNIEDRDVLMELAGDTGLDSALLDAMFDSFNLPKLPADGNLPVIQYWLAEQPRPPSTGSIELDDVAWRLSGSSLSIETVSWESLPLAGFISNHGPVPTQEVAKVFEIDSRTAHHKLEHTSEVHSVQFGDVTFWKM